MFSFVFPFLSKHTCSRFLQLRFLVFEITADAWKHVRPGVAVPVVHIILIVLHKLYGIKAQAYDVHLSAKVCSVSSLYIIVM